MCELDFFGGGFDDHAVADRSHTGGLEFVHHQGHLWQPIGSHHDLAGGGVDAGCPHFDQAHPAHADGLHFGVITKDRDRHISMASRIDDVGAGGDGNRLSINYYVYVWHRSLTPGCPIWYGSALVRQGQRNGVPCR